MIFQVGGEPLVSEPVRDADQEVGGQEKQKTGLGEQGGEGDAGADLCASAGGFAGARASRVAQGHYQYDAVDDADDAEDLEADAPTGALGDVPADAAQCRPGVDAGHVQAGGEGSGGSWVIIGDECEGGGD